MSSSFTDASPLNGKRLLAIGLTLAILGGLMAWGGVEQVLEIYRPLLFPKIKPVPDPEDIRLFTRARIESAAVAFAIFGGILGLTSGLAGGLSSRSLKKGTIGGVAGLLLGTILAAGVSILMVPFFFARHDTQANTLTIPLLTHGAIWSVIGATAGLALGLGLGRGRWKAACGGGFAGAIMATLVYELFGALVFPTDKTEFPVPGTAITRGLGLLFVAIASIGGAVVMVGQGAKKGEVSETPISE